MDYLVWICLLFCGVMQSVLAAESYTEGNIKDELSNNQIKSENISGCNCTWGEWMNNADYNPTIGDDNSYVNLRSHYDVCDDPGAIQCRSKLNPQLPFFIVQRKGVHCDVTKGLVCQSRPMNRNDPAPQVPFYCDDYEIRVYCCYCPQTTASTINFNVTSQSNLINVTTSGFVISGETVTSKTAIDAMQLVIPVSIIIVIVLALVVIVGIILCVLLSHKSRKTPKLQDDYMAGHTYLQRPVSFTDVDRRSIASSSSLGTSSSRNSYHGYQFNHLDKGKLLFIQPEREDQPDVISSTKHAPHQQASQERQWLPDEYERGKERQNARSGKKSLFSRSPNSPSSTTFAFPDAN